MSYFQNQMERNMQKINQLFEPHHKLTNNNKYTFSSNAHKILSQINNVLYSKKKNLHTFTSIEIIPNMFSDHNRVKLEIKISRNLGNQHNTKVKHTCSQTL